MNDLDPTQSDSNFEYASGRIESQLANSLKDLVTIQAKEGSRWVKNNDVGHNEGRPAKYLQFSLHDNTYAIPPDSTIARTQVEEFHVDWLPKTDEKDELITSHWKLSGEADESDIFHFTLVGDFVTELLVDRAEKASQGNDGSEPTSASRMLKKEALTLQTLIIAARELLEAEESEA